MVLSSRGVKLTSLSIWLPPGPLHSTWTTKVAPSRFLLRMVHRPQPAAKPGLQRMERVARDRLLDLRKQQIVVAHDEVADGRAFMGSGMKLGSREPRGRARQLNDRS